jgi:phosphonopyruvate decarboxylase
MINPETFFAALDDGGVSFYAGVPDSLLKDFCAYVTDVLPSSRHVIAANEGGAVALAAGHYLATGYPALVYLQNSGLGNCVNPLVSLADPAVYGLPMLLLVGWRGEPGRKDEPQHVKQGAITEALFEAMDIPCRILPESTTEAVSCLQELLELAMKMRRPVALLVRAGTFEQYKLKSGNDDPFPMNREESIGMIARALPKHALVVGTTGHISRELFEHRSREDGGRQRDFLTVGGMGHASQIALGVAMAQPERPVVCLDGDGAAIMHMGALGIIGNSGMHNLLHVVINNGAHDSVGGQPTVGFAVDFPAIALACGYARAERVESPEALSHFMADFVFGDGPAFLEVRVARGARKDLGRPTSSPAENKQSFMNFALGVG